jgi:hypothetical protein
MTPRTDARCCEPTEFAPGQEAQLIQGWIEFARKLERENLELAAALRAMLLMGHYPPAIEERTQAALKLITHGDAYRQTVNLDQPVRCSWCGQIYAKNAQPKPVQMNNNSSAR